MASECPPACVPGGSCTPGSFCTGSFFDPNDCVESCSCDATGHYVCALYSDYPSCPEVHPACGDACDPTTRLYCACTTDGGTTPCTCNATTMTWDCALPTFCSLLDTPPKAKCTDFPIGTPCGDVCQCMAKCGTSVWMCTI
ncbi:MAG TPA: hypothetical protein PKA58_36065 [Polyangium sp.]|nr:hypothetical protein [Polyangium sp.]